MRRYFSVFGLAFGDCGKGRFVDELCGRLGARLVVRYNGGAQAGHNVLRPDGRHHVFSSFGAGTLHPGIRTLLAAQVVIHPGGLLREAAALAGKGAPDALARLTIDARCRVTTPYLQAVGRLRELALGHGSCGIGFGETVRLALEHPEASLSYGELTNRGLARARLAAQRRILEEACADLTGAEKELFGDEKLGDSWLAQAAPLLRQVEPAAPERIAFELAADGVVIFEGAQGLLLDEDHGFHPHTTWSRVGPAAAEGLLEETGIAAPIEHLGVLRTYLTRHGAGPFPTFDPELDRLPEPHNSSAGFQGVFRRGHLDEVLLRYSLGAAGRPLAGVLVSHLDAFAAGFEPRWCAAYATPEGRIERLTLASLPDLDRQEQLTRRLASAEPFYEREPIGGAEALIERLEHLAEAPVCCGASGPLPGQTRLFSAFRRLRV